MFNIHIEIEKWRFNKTYSLYVSNMGNFKNKSKEVITPKVEKDGYLVIPVCNNKKGTIKYLFAHRVVMETWCPRANMWKDKLTVDHKNHNKRDNKTKNLEWVTRKENLARAAADFYRDDKDIEIQSLRDRVKILEERVEDLECSQNIIIYGGTQTFRTWREVRCYLIKLNENIQHLTVIQVKERVEKAARNEKTYCGLKWKIKYKEEI